MHRQSLTPALLISLNPVPLSTYKRIVFSGKNKAYTYTLTIPSGRLHNVRRHFPKNVAPVKPAAYLQEMKTTLVRSPNILQKQRTTLVRSFCKLRKTGTTLVRGFCKLRKTGTTLVRISCGLAKVKNHPGADLLRARKNKKPPWCKALAGSQKQKTTLVRSLCGLARAKNHPDTNLLQIAGAFPDPESGQKSTPRESFVSNFPEGHLAFSSYNGRIMPAGSAPGLRGRSLR